MYGLDAEVIAQIKAPTRLVLTQKAWARIIEIVKQRYPIEACGILAGKIEGDLAIVKEVRELRNILASPTAFWFDVTEWMDAILAARRKGMSYIGVFHSHPRDEPSISLSDRQRMLECPGEVWLVVAYTPRCKPRLAAWVIRGYGLGIARVKVEVAKSRSGP